MFRSRQLELREEAWGGRIKKSSTPFQLQGKSSLWTGYSNSTSTHPTERKTSNYLTQATHLSGELIAPPPLPPTPPPWHSRLELVLGTAWLAAGCRGPWWMLKELTLWPMSQRANNTASKVLCQVEYWFHVLCSLDTDYNTPPPSPTPPQSVLDWKKFNSFLLCALYCC